MAHLDDQVLIFDTTLRDGEQSPGCSMTQPEKLRVAKALAELGVDVIEAGFPAASRGDFDAVNAVAREVHGPIIAGLARCARDDIEVAAKALKAAERHRLHVFLATSAIHREFKLNMANDGDRPSRGGRREVGSRALRRRRILARGRLAHRARFPGRGGRGGHRGRRDHDQHSRHRRLHGAGRIRRTVPLSAQATCAASTRCVCRCTATTTSAWRSPTAWRRWSPVRARSSAPSTASASAPATARSRKS